MKHVLLTGASGGLGIKLAEYLLQKDYYVIMVYNTHGDDVIELSNKYPNSLVLKTDLTNEEDLNQLLSNIEDMNVDILINNAAIDNTCDINDKTKEEFMRIYELNTYVPFKLMRDINYKTCVNISSENAIDTYDSVSVEYDLSKLALNRLQDIFRDVYPDRVINTICFGWLDTPMNNLDEDIKQHIEFVPFDKACNEIEKLFEENKDIVIVRK